MFDEQTRRYFFAVRLANAVIVKKKA